MFSITCNTPARVFPKSGYNLYGENQEGPARDVLVAVVALADATVATPLRRQVSATEGRAEEEVAKSKLLFPPGDPIRLGDRVEVYAISLEVTGLFPRADVFGSLADGHIRVELKRQVV